MGDENEKLPKEKRSCTDPICLLLFIGFWVGMVAVGALSFIQGDVNRVTVGYDYEGRTCGGKGTNPVTNEAYDLSDRAKLFYPYPWLAADITTIGPEVYKDSKYNITEKYSVCVAECPTKATEVAKIFLKDKSDGMICNYGDDSKDITGKGKANKSGKEVDVANTCALSMAGLKIAKNPLTDEDCSFDKVAKMSKADKAAKGCDEPSSEGLDKPSSYLSYKTEGKEGFSRCIPGGTGSAMKKIKAGFDAILEKADKLGSLVDKLSKNWYFIAIAAVLALIVGFAYLWFLKIAGKAMVWITIVGVIVFCLGSAAMAWSKTAYVPKEALAVASAADYTPPDPAAEDTQLLWTVAAAVMTVVSIFVLLVVIVLAKRINEATKIMGLTTKSFSDMPAILFFPAIMWVAVIALTAWFVSVLIFQMTAGVFNEHKFTYEWDDTMKKMAAYNFFGYLWTKAFLGSIGDITVALAVATWYFSTDRKEVSGAVFGSFRKVLRYHVGTVAFGSLIIAIVQFVRVMVNLYLKQAEAHKNNKIIKLLACCFNYCMAYVERVLKFLNRNAYIQCAIHGTSFLKSAKNAVVLLGKNFLRLAAITMVSGVFIFLGKLVIALGTTFICYVAMENAVGSADPFTILIILLLSFSIAHVFMNIYNMGIDAMFQCFCTKPELADDSMKSVGDGLDKGESEAA